MAGVSWRRIAVVATLLIIVDPSIRTLASLETVLVPREHPPVRPEMTVGLLGDDAGDVGIRRTRRLIETSGYATISAPDVDELAASAASVWWIAGRDLDAREVSRIREVTSSGVRVVIHGVGMRSLQPGGQGAVRASPTASSHHVRLRIVPPLLGLVGRPAADEFHEVSWWPSWMATSGAGLGREENEGDTKLVVTERGGEVVAACTAIGAGASIVSAIPLHTAIRFRPSVREADALEQIYLPGLLAYAAWGGCNDRTRVIPVRLDVIPGDRENRITRRGVPVAVLGTSWFDPVEEIDRATLRFGRSGREPSLYNCLPRARDVNGDGRQDLRCIFRYNATGIGTSRSAVRLTGLTRAGIEVWGQASAVVATS